MSNKNNPVSINTEQQLGFITINYPPVNALGYRVRRNLLDAIETLEDDNECKIIIIQCVGKTFIAGADIKEFGKAAVEPFLPDVVNRIEASKKPVVASLFGTVLGGGLEVALACHYRLALSSTKVGFPEVNLGLIPGAGGTQRLMRLTGISKAVEMICSGKHYPVTKLQDFGLFDAIFTTGSDEHLTTLQQQTMGFCKQLIANNALQVNAVGSRSVNTDNVDWHAAKESVINNARGRIAPVVAFEVIQQTRDKTIHEGMAIEREAFLQSLGSEQSMALRYAFAAEKKAVKPSVDSTALDVTDVGVIGGGTMGVGIAVNFLNAGFRVRLIEQTESAAETAYERVNKLITASVKKGRITSEVAASRLGALASGTDKKSLANCQLVVEAVFEDIEIKKTLFAELEASCNGSTIFASNTSYLDINEMAQASKRPGKVIGMHFFSPAHIMKLLEVVEADKTADTTLATVMKVGKKLGKIPVVVKVCFGFAGNRTYSRYGREIQQILLEGASVAQIDGALTRWGMAMGPLAVQDLSGIDIGYNARKSRPVPADDPGYFQPASLMVEHGRLGRKTQAGFYRYDEAGNAFPDSVVDEIIADKALQMGISQQQFSDEEIVDRALLALISEGLALFSEGIVQRLSDIDAIWLNGYGFPRYRGGPMFQAQQMGIEKLVSKMETLQQQYGKTVWPDLDYELIIQVLGD